MARRPPRKPPREMKHDTTTNRAYVRWSGEKFYFGYWGSIEASQKFTEWYSSIVGDVRQVPSPAINLNVRTCVARYLKHAKTYYSKNGIPSQEFRNVSAAMGTLMKTAGRLMVTDFGPRKLTAIQSALSMETIGDPPRPKYARNSINARIHRIRRCFRWCAGQEIIPAGIVTALDMVPALSIGRSEARESDPVEPVSIDVVQKTLPFLSPTVGAMARVQLLCGMRPQDVCGMSVPMIDMTSDIWLYRPLRHKGTHRGTSLTKAIPPAAQEIIRPFLRPDGPLFSPDDSLAFWRSQERKRVSRKKPKQRGYYSTGSYGKSIVYAISRAAKQGIVIPHWTPNQLRHAIATTLREKLGIEASQLYLGHKKPDVTLIYAERSLRALSEIARQMISPFDTQ